ncbi:hypothetical protein HDU96_007624 [Phlyctochytrium bullatum]|nr:hypothetical protein HDU96_007624 [Phlyctochytrium bullatum]
MSQVLDLVKASNTLDVDRERIALNRAVAALKQLASASSDVENVEGIRLTERPHGSPGEAVPTPLIIGNVCMGFIPSWVLPAVLEHPKVFYPVHIPSELHDLAQSPVAIRLDPALTTREARTLAVEGVLKIWKDQNRFSSLKGWRNERYAVWGGGMQGEVVMEVERAGAGLLGLRAYGCHANGYVVGEDGQVKMWVAKRSATKQTYPSLLDNLVGGGLPYPLHPDVCMEKECFEEAGLTSAQLHPSPNTGLKSVSVISYFMDSADRGILPDLEFIYDVKLPLNWKPECQDGEVQAFYLLGLEEVKEKLLAREFTPEAGLVTLDFLIRHGHVNAGNEPYFAEIVTLLRRRLPFPGPSFPIRSD